MMPALEARESLRHVTEIAAGNGLIEKSDRERTLNQWRRDAQGGLERATLGPVRLESVLTGFALTEVGPSGEDDG